MHDWEKFNETSLPEKEEFYSHLNIEDITEADHTHSKRDWKDFEIKIILNYHDLCVQSDALLLADIFGKFRNMCLDTYEIDPAIFIFCTRISIKISFKRKQIRIIFFNVYRHAINGKKRN